MKKLRNKGLLFLLAAVTLTMTACSAQTAPKEADPVTVTMFGFWKEDKGETAEAFQIALEKKYPDIHLEYEGFPTGAEPYTDELTRRIAHGKGTDIFMTTDISLAGSDKLLDLTQEAFVGCYSRAMMQQLTDAGAVRFIPSVGALQCYVYDTGMFQEKPETLEELEQFCRQASGQGETSFLVPYEQTKPLMIKALGATYLTSPKGRLWTEDYSAKKVTMSETPEWQAIWDRAERMIQDGILTAEDMVFAESRRIIMVSQGVRGMSVLPSSQLATIEKEDTSGERFNLIPFMGEKAGEQVVFSDPICYFAAAAELDKPEHIERKKAVLNVLDFISTPEGQQIISGNSSLSNSYLNEVELSLDTRYQDIKPVLDNGFFSWTPNLKNGVDAAIGEAFGKMLLGEMTAAEAMAFCDAQNTGYEEMTMEAPVVLGMAEKEFPWTFKTSRTKELAVTNFVIDSMRSSLGTDIAFELGTAVRGEFFEGEITDQDIHSVIRADKKLYRVSLTGQQLWDIIEQGVISENSSWFIVVSGLKYRYQPMTEGEAGVLLALSLSDGTPIEPDKVYEAGVSENQLIEVKDVLNLYGEEAEETGLLLRDVVRTAIEQQETIQPVLDGRIVAEGN